jgi:hypothetical protein
MSNHSPRTLSENNQSSPSSSPSRNEEDDNIPFPEENEEESEGVNNLEDDDLGFSFNPPQLER